MQKSKDRISEIERSQPDPQLQLSHGHASKLQITLVALACVIILGMMIYGLSRPERDGSAAWSPSPQTSGSAPTSEPGAPQTGGNVAGGENAAPKSEAVSQDQPAKKPVPQLTKPGVTEDDSAR